jgi:hypothetical protein
MANRSESEADHSVSDRPGDTESEDAQEKSGLCVECILFYFSFFFHSFLHYFHMFLFLSLVFIFVFHLPSM